MYYKDISVNEELLTDNWGDIGVQRSLSRGNYGLPHEDDING